MSNCVNDVKSAMAGAALTLEEEKIIEEWCAYGAAPFMIVRLLKFNRAAVELRGLIKAKGLAGDEALWNLAFELLAKLMDPAKALEQAWKEIAASRAEKAAQAIPEKLEKFRSASGPGSTGRSPGKGSQD